MRKFLAILLIAIAVFNLIGYRFLFYLQLQQSNTALETSLDKSQYNKAELITIKVPLSMPYLTSSAKFERVDGEITLSGKTYKYVERRVYNGVMELKCLPDYNKARIETAKNDYFKSINDLQQNTSKKSNDGKVSKNTLSEFDNFQQRAAKIIALQKQLHVQPHYAVSLTSGIHLSPEQPPEIA